MGLTQYYALDAPDANDPINTSQAAIENAFVTIDAELKRIADLVAALPEANVTGLTAALAAKVAKTTLDANTILYATTDDTPAALSVAASRIVGRKASGNIAALTPAEVQEIITASVYDPYQTIASAGTSQTLDTNTYKVFDLTLDNASTCVITLTGGTSGKAWWATAIYRQDGTGDRPAPSYANTIYWDGDGNPPVPPSAAGSFISVAFLTYDGGTTWYGFGGTAVPVSRQIELPIAEAVLPDGTGTINAAARLQYTVNSGTQTTNAPKLSYHQLLFDPSTDQHAMWEFMMPVGYIDSGSVRFRVGSSATSGNVIFKASIARIADSSTDMDSGNTVFETVALGGAVTVPGTVGQVVEYSITLAGDYTAAKEVVLFVGRDADNASDTCASDAFIVGHVTFEYRGL